MGHNLIPRWRSALETAMVALVAAINLVPVAGLFSSDRLSQLYGIDASDSTLMLLLTHRALLFATLGGFVLMSIFRPHWRVIAMTLAAVSMAGFMWLAWPYSILQQSMQTIFLGDLAGMICWLVWGLSLITRSRRAQSSPLT